MRYALPVIFVIALVAVLYTQVGRSSNGTSAATSGDGPALEEIRGRLTAHLREQREITPAGFRDLIAASRKYCIPLLDWFDREGLTIRVGDLRKLRQSS